MKNKTYLNMIGIFFASMLLFAACQKDEPVKLDPSVATLQILNLTDSSAEVSGLVIAEGDGFTERGVCWNTDAAPTISNFTASVKKSSSSVYTAKLGDLNYTTKYYVRAYATNAAGTTVYSQDTAFTTPVRLPIVTLTEATDIAQYTATTGGNVTELGGGTVTAKGVCWGTEPDPNVKDNDTTINGEGIGAFSSSITGLLGGTQYYYRAYATNEAGTTYSKSYVAGFERKLTFSTLPGLPVVSTKTAIGAATTATASGEVTHDGGKTITQRGICYSTSANPTTADSKVTSPGTIGLFEVSILGLTENTSYHARAYAINSVGTAYGEDKTFATLPTIGYIVGSINGWNNHGQYLAARGSNVFTGYQYLDAAAEFKFFPVRDSWDNGWGQGASAGTLVSGGGNIKAIDLAGYTAPGFYEVEFDLANNTVKITLADTWGVIGDAQAGGWGTDVNLTFSTITKIWTGQVTFLGTGAYKFRANDDWAINVGGVLTALTNGGGNINSPVAGIYDIVLDLSGADSFNATVTLAP